MRSRRLSAYVMIVRTDDKGLLWRQRYWPLWRSLTTGRSWPGLLSGPYEFIATKRPINSRDPETKLGKSALLTRCSCGILTCEYVQLKT